MRKDDVTDHRGHSVTTSHRVLVKNPYKDGGDVLRLAPKLWKWFSVQFIHVNKLYDVAIASRRKITKFVSLKLAALY